MSVVLGGNGAGKTSLLDAIAFATCARGSEQPMNTEVSEDSSVTLILADGSQFRRQGKTDTFIGGRPVPERIYKRRIRSKLCTYYVSQLSRPQGFLEAKSLARFIECEQLANVSAPPLEDLNSFNRLVSNVESNFRAWKQARADFSNASTEVKAAHNNLARLRRSRKQRGKIAELERRIHVLRQVQLLEAVEETHNKIAALENGIRSLEEKEAVTARDIEECEAEIRAGEQRYKQLEKQLCETGRELGDYRRKALAAIESINATSEEESATTQSASKYEGLTDFIDDLLKHKFPSVETDLTDFEHGQGHTEDIYEGEHSSDGSEALLSLVERCEDIFKSIDIFSLQVTKSSALEAREDYQRSLEECDKTNQKLLEEFRALDSKLNAVELGITEEPAQSSETAAQERRDWVISLAHLKDISGVLGLLHEQVRPHNGHEKALWSVMGEDAQLLLVKDERALAKSMEFLSRVRFRLVSGIVNLSEYHDAEALDDAIYWGVKDLCPLSYALWSVVDIVEGEYKKRIATLATKRAMIVPDVYEFIRLHENEAPVCFYCDIKGTARTPAGALTKCDSLQSYTDIGTAPRSPATRLDTSPVCIEDELLCAYDERDVVFSATDLTCTERTWILKKIDAEHHHRRRLIRRLKKLLQAIGTSDNALQSTSLTAARSGAFADVEQHIALVSGSKLDGAVKRRIYRTLGVVYKIRSRLSVVEAKRDDAKKQLTLMLRKLTQLRQTRENEEALLRGLDTELLQLTREMGPLFAQYEQAKSELDTARSRHAASMRTLADIQRDLEPIKQVKSLMEEDLYYLELAERAVSKTVDESYAGIDSETRLKEESSERWQASRMRPEDLIKERTAVLEALPAPLRGSRDNGIEDAERDVADCEAAQVRADEAQIVALQTLDEATQRLEEAKLRRRQRTAQNLAELARVASKIYQNVVVGRQATPRIQRLFLVPLDDEQPWEGVMCALHPVGKQYTPAVQLSSCEMAIAELCIKMAAFLGDGTRLVLYDEVDAGLDMLTCNALGNFIRRWTGLPGGGQAIMATHKRATYNTAHYMIGVYRVREEVRYYVFGSTLDLTASGDETPQETKPPREKITYRDGPTLVITHFRRFDRAQPPPEADARLRPQNPYAGIYAS